MIKYRKFITRNMLREEPNNLFVFGDNVIQHGFGGQAKEMRGEPNAVGIPTKWKPNNERESFFYDFQFPAVKFLIDASFSQLNKHLGDIIWPEDGIGTGLARLTQTAPLIWRYIEKKKAQLEQNLG